MIEHVVVVGASLAGVRACGSLRASGFAGSITLIGAEAHEPYDRPPLSKKLLSGEWEPERIALTRPGELESLNLDMRLGVAAVGLDVESREVQLSDGSSVGFDGLLIATGAGLRPFSLAPLDPSIFALRTLDDSLGLRARLAPGDQRVVVIGAGFIGLEVAATAHELGNIVTVLEGASAPLIRGLGERMGSLIGTLHEARGVALHCAVSITAIERGDHGLVVSLADGTAHVADVLVIGVGVAPAIEWLRSSGLSLGDGVNCDETLNAGPVGVYAIGDVARWPNGQFDGEMMRVEHWTNASEQAAAAVHNMLAVDRGEAPTPFASVPFFWSDQYDHRIQFIGRAAGDDEIHIVQGSVSENKFVALYTANGKMRAVLGLSMPKQVMRCRRFLLDKLDADEAIAAATAL